MLLLTMNQERKGKDGFLDKVLDALGMQSNVKVENYIRDRQTHSGATKTV